MIKNSSSHLPPIIGHTHKHDSSRDVDSFFLHPHHNRDEQALERIDSHLSASTSFDQTERLLTALEGIRNNVRGISTEIHVARTAPHVVAIGRRFFPDMRSASSKPVLTPAEVDIVACGGALWIEAKALRSCGSDARASLHEILDQAKLRLALAQHNPHRYRIPQLAYHFTTSAVAPELVAALQSLGVHVSISAGGAFATEGLPADVLHPPPLTAALLDVSTLCALVSEVSRSAASGDEAVRAWALRGNQHHRRCFEDERSQPLLPVLENLLHGKELRALRSTVDHFEHNLLAMFGGERERRRWAAVRVRLIVVEDGLPFEVGVAPDPDLVGAAVGAEALLVTANSRLQRHASEGATRGAEVEVHRAVWLTGT